MSTASYATVHQVLPFFNLLFSRLDGFLDCGHEYDTPDFEALAAQGKPIEIVEAVVAARAKLSEYYDKTCHVPIYAVATGNLIIKK